MFDIPIKFIPKNTEYVFTINNSRVKKYDPNLVGYCANKKHIGFLTTRDIHDHQCREKQCSCLKMLTHRDNYWGKYLEEQKIKEEKSLAKRREQKDRKEMEDRIKKHWELFVQKGNQWLAEEGYGNFIEIVSARVIKNENKVNIIYASDRKLLSYEFNDILCHFKMQAGKFDVYLTRAKGADGEYVTIEDWHNSPRYKEMQNERK